MPLMRLSKTSFAAGEISPQFLGRTDSAPYDQGAARLRNVVIHPTGGVTRRPGLRYVDAARGAGRLIAFEFSVTQTYLLALTHLKLDVYRDGALSATLDTPWTAAQLGQINWTQNADTLLVVHPDVSPRKITRASHTSWSIAEWTFASKDNTLYQPHYRFADPAITLTPSGTTGSITLAASADVFQAGHVGTRFRLDKKQVEITAVTSPTQAGATVKETLIGTAATKTWDEQAFSAVRGWPVAVAYHQDRLVIGGSRDVPNRMWLSKTATSFNFDLGTGLDDESIEFGILSDSANAVRAIFSGRHLQIFTSGAEWMVSGEPLTAKNMQVRRQTRVGSRLDRTVTPRDVDGATLFVARTGHEIREFVFTDVEQAYQARDLALRASQLINWPRDQDYDSGSRLLYVVMDDGAMAVLTVYRGEGIVAWTGFDTQGAFRSVAVVADKVYVLVERGTSHLIERFDVNLNVDSGLDATAGTPGTVWSGLDHIEGKTVKVLGDGAVLADAVVGGGAVELAQPVNAAQIGLGYAHVIEPLPPASGSVTSQGSSVRLVSATFRLVETAVLCLDVGRGLTEVPFKRFGGDTQLDAPPRAFTGDKTVRALGWTRDGISPLWRIEQDIPLPFGLLSVVAEIKTSD